VRAAGLFVFARRQQLCVAGDNSTNDCVQLKILLPCNITFK
jgi:hypothetical protein